MILVPPQQGALRSPLYKKRSIIFLKIFQQKFNLRNQPAVCRAQAQAITYKLSHHLHLGMAYRVDQKTGVTLAFSAAEWSAVLLRCPVLSNTAPSYLSEIEHALVLLTCTHLKQKPEDSQVSSSSRQVKRSISLTVARLNIRSSFQQQSRHLRVSAKGCAVQWCVPIHVLHLGSSLLHQELHHLPSAAESCSMENCLQPFSHLKTVLTIRRKDDPTFLLIIPGSFVQASTRLR